MLRRCFCRYGREKMSRFAEHKRAFQENQPTDKAQHDTTWENLQEELNVDTFPIVCGKTHWVLLRPFVPRTYMGHARDTLPFLSHLQSSDSFEKQQPGQDNGSITL
ncbi:hypothetical protein TNIN_372091 [Trichonephila inaurata madagascariensis]|uniref:Uncharacterized protein n=1 Tax=Trichonephila inaurata madagascariensis TaxID=2747483 RepID=A0A8X6Y319_9ARAC|nr:hypothetical protein TNIN_372091 [Trichonephila inaurata madagascariensis]